MPHGWDPTTIDNTPGAPLSPVMEELRRRLSDRHGASSNIGADDLRAFAREPALAPLAPFLVDLAAKLAAPVALRDVLAAAARAGF